MAVTLYCDEDDVADWLSDFGIQLRVTDSPPTALGRALERASTRINWFCLRRYTAEALAASDCIRDAAGLIATVNLCSRRGNPMPGVYKDFYNELVNEKTGLLWEVKKGLYPIPDATPRRESAPAVVHTTWRLWPTPHSRERTGTSTGKVTSYSRRRDYRDPGTWGMYDYVI